MKPIITKEDIERKEKRNKIVIGIILILLMGLSTAGYAFYDNAGRTSPKVVYNNIKFVLNDDGYWHFTIQGKEFLTRYNAQETQNISASLTKTLSDYSGKPLYFDANSDRSFSSEIVMTLQDYASRIQYACLGNCEGDFPIKNCSTDNVIIITSKNQSKIWQNQNCVYIEGEGLKEADAFLFKLLGVK